MLQRPDNKDELFESSPVRQSWNNTDEQNLDITKRDLIECINIYRKPQTKKHEDHFLKRWMNLKDFKTKEEEFKIC